MMRSTILSIAFCVAVQAAPARRPRHLASDLVYTTSRPSNSIENDAGRIVGDFTREEEEINHLIHTLDDLTDSEEHTLRRILWTTLPQNARASIVEEGLGTSHADVGILDEFEPTEEEPALEAIISHLEAILDSGASAFEQVQWIQDAIVHPKESPRDTRDQHVPSDVVFERILSILVDASSSTEKVEAIVTEVSLHAGLRESSVCVLDRDPERNVLCKTRAILSEPQTAQKKIKKILNGIAEHLLPQREESFGADQKTLSGVVADVVKEHSGSRKPCYPCK